MFIISGEINDELVAEFALYVHEENPPYMFLNSQGGDEHAGRAIAGIMKASKMLWTVQAHGDVHSAAVIILAAATVRKLSRTATVMVHESSLDEVKDANSTKLKNLYKQMESDEKFWCALLEEFTGTSTKVWMDLHEKETYLRPQDALTLNLATEII